MRPEARKQILPLTLLIAALACGGVCWFLEGTAFWVLAGAAAVLIVAGLITASRVETARREKSEEGSTPPPTT